MTSVDGAASVCSQHMWSQASPGQPVAGGSIVVSIETLSTILRK